MSDFNLELQKALGSGEPFALVTVISVQSSTPREPGAKMIVHNNGTVVGTIGGGKLEELAKKDALDSIFEQKSVYKNYSLMPEDKGGIGTECGGDASVFIDVFAKAPKLLVFGGGHIAHALYKIAMVLGYNMEIFDNRPEFASQERFPNAKVHAKKIEEINFNSVIDKGSLVIIITHSHEIDKELLAKVLEHPPLYVGMIGSKRKVRVILDEIEKEGTDKKKLDAVFSPIGLDIGAETPEEIAIAIISEIISIRRKGESPLSLKARKNK